MGGRRAPVFDHAPSLRVGSFVPIGARAAALGELRKRGSARWS
jgi:hypothetical protein